ncbi:MAG: universal stress protein [Chitinophagaceae bacterium]|nr:universal stress protein [Chitinophagaceae bacterium]
MKAIIVPVDFSDVSSNAAIYAADMAMETSCVLILLHVVQLPVSFAVGSFPQSVFEEMMDIGKERLKEMKDLLDKHANNKIEVQTNLAVGSVEYELEELCNRKQTLAVVMGTAGGDFVKALLVGRNTLNAVTHLPHPVFVIPPGIKYKGVKKIAMALDLQTEDGNLPFDSLIPFLTQFRPELHIVNIAPAYNTNTHMVDDSIDVRNAYHGWNPIFHFLKGNDVVKGLNDFASDNKIDLLAIVIRKHTIWEKIFIKSHSKELVTHPEIPLIALKAEKEKNARSIFLEPAEEI